MALIQALIAVALDRVEEELRADVARLVDEQYVRVGRLQGHVRWTPERGCNDPADQKKGLGEYPLRTAFGLSCSMSYSMS